MYDIALCELHKHNSLCFKTVSDWVKFFSGRVSTTTSHVFLILLNTSVTETKTKTECNHVNNKLGAKYGANELFGSVNFTDCLKLAR